MLLDPCFSRGQGGTAQSVAGFEPASEVTLGLSPSIFGVSRLKSAIDHWGVAKPQLKLGPNNIWKQAEACWDTSGCQQLDYALELWSSV
jgi:hypothetical protein